MSLNHYQSAGVRECLLVHSLHDSHRGAATGAAGEFAQDSQGAPSEESAVDVEEYLRELAQVNRNGFGFLIAYGCTWLVAAVLSRRFGERVGTFAALFQGMVGLPFGLLLTSVAAAGRRPEDPTLNALSIYLSAGQLLTLPFAVVLIMRERYAMAVAVLAVTLAVHFVPYAWLYGTPVYVVAAAVIAIGTAALVARSTPDRGAGERICVLTGATLLGAGLAALAT